MTLDLQTVGESFQTNWGWAAGLAASMLGLTLLAGKLLNPARKDEIALWLMGAQSEESWSRSFCSLFDAVFGEKHLSWRCLRRSAIASLLAVLLIWLLMGNSALALRIGADTSLVAVVAAALAVNLVADYVSLLETRFLLGRMPRSVAAQVLVLLADLVVSAAIIWIAIRAYLASPLYEGEAESFAEIVGVFSMFSVLFYSTFLTSVWTWGYILATWVLKLFTRLRLPHWLDVEHKPVAILGYVLAAIVFVGSLGTAAAMQKDDSGLTAVDRVLCSTFKGPVCLKVAELTQEEQAQFDMILFACEGGITEECFIRGIVQLEQEPEQATRLLEMSCHGGDAVGCTFLGYLYFVGEGVEIDMPKSARYFRLACDGGDASGCNLLGFLYSSGQGVKRDSAAAAQLYERGCDLGHDQGCNLLEALEDE